MRENDVAQIREQYKLFLKAWQDGDEALFDKCLKYIPFGYVSMFGHTYDAGQIKKWFCNPGPERSNLTIYPLQDTILTQDNQAQQYAVILGLIKKDERHIAFGGSFMNHYEKTEDGWVLETIRFQLQSDDGNKDEYLDAEGIVHRIAGEGDRSLFGNWLGVDERVGAFQDKIENSGDQMITAELDAPWRMLKNPDNTMTEEEKIQDVLCRTSCAFDFFAMSIAIPAFDAQATVDIGGLFGVMNKRDALIYVKELRKSMPRCFSGICVEDLMFADDKATAKLNVLAPEAYTTQNGGCCFVKDSYQIDFVKSNGDWAISKLIRVAK